MLPSTGSASGHMVDMHIAPAQRSSKEHLSVLCPGLRCQMLLFAVENPVAENALHKMYVLHRLRSQGRIWPIISNGGSLPYAYDLVLVQCRSSHGI